MGKDRKGVISPAFFPADFFYRGMGRDRKESSIGITG